MKRSTKSLIRANIHSSINRSNLHSPTKRVVHNGMIMMKVIIKITKTKRSSNQMIALNVVIIDTKKASDAQPVDTSAKFVQKLDISQKCVSSKIKKQQCIQLVQAHDDQTVTLQMSDESFHDANEEYMPSDDDFMHNYMVHVYKTSLQQKTGTSSKFQ